MSFLKKCPRMILAGKKIAFSTWEKGSQMHDQCVSDLMGPRCIRLGKEVETVKYL